MNFHRIVPSAALLAAAVLHHVNVYGQGRDRSTFNIVHRNVTLDPVNIVAISHETGRILVGPDPTNASALINLLVNKNIAEELQLSEEQRKAIADVVAAERRLFNSDPDGSASDVVRSLRRAAMDEILTPSQAERLKQIVYRMEVGVFGLGGALANGRLGENANIHENQRNWLVTKGAQIDAIRDATVKKLRLKAEQQIIQCLQTEQQHLLRALIGEYFLSSSAGLIRLAPIQTDLEDKDHLFRLLRDLEIQEELAIDVKDLKAIDALLAAQAVRRRLSKSYDERKKSDAADRLEREELLESILDEPELQRLKQLAYRVEISADGLVQSIVNGRLRDKLAIGEVRASELLERGNSIERELTLDIADAFEKAENELLGQLAPEQRRTAKSLLGSIFMDRDYVAGMKSAVNRIKEERKASTTPR